MKIVQIWLIAEQIKHEVLLLL